VAFRKEWLQVGVVESLNVDREEIGEERGERVSSEEEAGGREEVWREPFWCVARHDW